MITGAQCRAARALAEISRDNLAKCAHINLAVIRNFERKLKGPGNEVVSEIKRCLETAGVVFISENGGGVGVRLKFNSSDTKRLGVLESEGGAVANDDVP